jgi:HlyD family secretion protein
MSKKTSRLIRFASSLWQRYGKLIVVIVLSIAGLGAIIYRRTVKHKQIQQFVLPIRQDITQNLEVSGVIDADEKVRLRFLAGGKVVYLGAKEGDLVKKYQTIATIDQALLNKQLQQNLNNYLIQREDWEQTRDDYVENGDGIPQPIADVETQRLVKKQQLLLNNSVLNVEMQNLTINNNRLTAPFTGFLTHAPTITVGGQLTANDYFEIINPQTLVFKIAVDEADVAQVKPHLPAIISLDAYPNDTINSQVDSIAYTSSQTSDGSTVFIVKLPLEDSSLERFRLGMNGDAFLKLDERHDVLTLPLETLSEQDGQWYVQIKNGRDNLEKRKVEVGLMNDELAEITAGLNERDQVFLPD